MTTAGVPRAQGAYATVVVHGGLAMTAGMTPRVAGQLWRRGVVGDTVTVEDAQECMRIATGNGLDVLADRLGGLDAIEACLRMTVYLACAPDFVDHSRLADAGSAVLRERLGDRGTPVRSAVGVATLPGGAPVEVELTVAVAGTQA
jgi:enamine deaminase RidA (YjgF/YER057c/UK114 family)